jgi:enoyl-CoA hydratase / 3-hydroxyacyl-CoA dehydrogenase
MERTMSEQKESESIIIQHDGPVMRVILNRPAKMNALNAEMFAGLLRAAEEVSADKNFRAMIISGTGKAFCAGGDLSGVPGKNAGADKGELIRGFRRIQEVFDRIEALPVPTIAEINGVALGAGLQLALVCDFRIAARAAVLGLPDVKNGIVPGLGATTRLPRLIGLSRAKELILTGDPISAERALEIGLVHKVVEPADLKPASEELCRKMLRRAPLAFCAAKRLLDSDAGLDEVAAVQIDLMTSNDAAEGITAFFEKRPPRFTGS